MALDTPLSAHLTSDEVELWAHGLLPGERAIHLADCAACRAVAERERKMYLELAQLPRFAAEYGFVDRVMAQVKIPTPSGDFRV
jgi:hypothetical protein